MEWRKARPLDFYFIEPVGQLGGLSWHLIVPYMALSAVNEDRHALDSPHGVAALIWTDTTEGVPMVRGIVGRAALKNKKGALRAARKWLDNNAAGAYAYPEDDNNPAFARLLAALGFKRVDERLWQWRF